MTSLKYTFYIILKVLFILELNYEEKWKIIDSL